MDLNHKGWLQMKSSAYITVSVKITGPRATVEVATKGYLDTTLWELVGVSYPTGNIIPAWNGSDKKVPEYRQDLVLREDKHFIFSDVEKEECDNDKSD